MIQHISIRVPWHDNGWNGNVCNCPQTNSSCLRLKNIYENKDDARSFFNRMRQRFIDWNYTEFESDAFKKAEAEIDTLYNEGVGKLTVQAESLLKDGE